MKEQLQQRLAELKTQFESGQKMLVDFQTQEANLRNTLLRISGAIQVLEDVLKGDHDESMSPGPFAEPAASITQAVA